MTVAQEVSVTVRWFGPHVRLHQGVVDGGQVVSSNGMVEGRVVPAYVDGFFHTPREVVGLFVLVVVPVKLVVGIVLVFLYRRLVVIMLG